MPISPEALARILAGVDALPVQIGAHLNTQNPQLVGTPGSPSEADRAEHGHPDAQDTVISQANILLEASGDYLFAVPRLLNEPAMAIAPYSSARGVLESSSQLHWLLESDIGGSARLDRSLSLRFHGLSERLKFANAAMDQSMVYAAKARLRVLEQTAKERGVQIRRNSRGDAKQIGEVLPKATALAEEFLTAGSSYRLLSAVTHSQGSFLLATSFKATERRGHMEKSLNTDSAAFLLINSAAWFARAVWRLLTYLGTADNQLTSVLESAYDAIGISDSMRFWRAG